MVQIDLHATVPKVAVPGAKNVDPFPSPIRSGKVQKEFKGLDFTGGVVLPANEVIVEFNFENDPNHNRVFMVCGDKGTAILLSEVCRLYFTKVREVVITPNSRIVGDFVHMYDGVNPDIIMITKMSFT